VLLDEAEKYEADATLLERQQAAEDELRRARPRQAASDPVPTNLDTPEVRKAPAIKRARYSKLHNFNGDGAEERAYTSGMWIRGALLGDARARKWCESNDIEIRTAQAEGTEYLGGYLVPEEFMQTIIDLRETYGVFRREAFVLPMGSDTSVVPRRATGLTAYAIGENTEITESNATWDQVRVTAKKWAVLTKMSNELAADAVISLADWLAGEIAYQFAYKEDQCGFIGDGTSTYAGIHGATIKINDGNHAGSIVTSVEQAFSALILTEFESVVGKLPTYATTNAKWYISKAGFYASMARLMDAVGGNTIDHIAGGKAMQFLGYPVVFTDVMISALTDQTSLILALFGDLRQAATMGVRGGVEMMVDSSRYMEYDQTAIRGTERFDINVHELGGASTAGSLVALKTASS
jgi:HK97 family phage major capsid protein